MSRFRFLDLVRPFLPIFTIVPQPNHIVHVHERVFWTATALLIYFTLSEIPLYGITSSDSADLLYRTRAILASHRGTFMELGITPILSSKLIVEVLARKNLIQGDFSSPEDCALYFGAQKLIALVISLGQATVYVLTGTYGLSRDLGAGICLLLIIQLVFATLILILLDELFVEGYAIGDGTGNVSSTSLFSGANICRTIIWKTLSPITVDTGKGTQFEGALVSLVHLLFTCNDKGRTLEEAFWREGLPNVMNIITTVAVLAVITYLSDFHVEIPVKSTQLLGQRGTYPIWLFHVHPVFIFEGALTSTVLIISQMLANRFPNSFAVRFLGVWEPLTNSPHFAAVSGITYYMSPPHTVEAAFLDPVHIVIYVAFRVTGCALYWRTWMMLSGRSARAIAQELQDAHFVLDGDHKSSMHNELEGLVPTAPALGGALVGLLCVVADLIGTVVGGNEILMAMMCSWSFAETTKREFDSDPVICWSFTGVESSELDTTLLASLEYVSSGDASRVGKPIVFPFLSSLGR